MKVFLLASLITVVSSGTNSLVELRASGVVAEPCHSRVTLLCNVSPEKDLTVSNLSWIHKKTTLCTDSSTALMKDDRIVCSYTPQARLALTISHLWPTDQGDYICKLRSNRGMKSVMSKVKVQECYRAVDTVSSPSQVACHFYGVYPQGTVHWFHQGNNVTSEAVNSVKPNHKGMYSVSSTLLTKGGSNEYNCSLWIPNRETYLNSTRVHASETGLRATAVSVHIVGLGWYLLLGRVAM